MPDTPVVAAALVIDSNNIAMLGIGLALAHVRSYGGYVTHMAWPADKWIDARAAALRAIGNYLPRPAAPRQAVASDWELSTPGGLWLP
jgi:hypothetical protein